MSAPGTSLLGNFNVPQIMDGVGQPAPMAAPTQPPLQEQPQQQLGPNGKPLPKPGDVVNYHRFVGGNPADPSAWKPLHGKDFLAELEQWDPAMAGRVHQLVTGQIPYPTSSGMGANPNSDALRLKSAATMYDPNFNAQVYKVRAGAWEDFTKGNTSKLLGALNQAPLHTRELADAYDHMNNSNYGWQWMNDAANNFVSGFSPSKQAALGAFAENQPAVAGELASVYKGGSAPTIPEEDAQKKAFPSGAQPSFSNAALAKAATLMHDRLKVTKAKWHNAMGDFAPFPIITPEAEKAINDLYSRYHQNGTTSAGAAVAPAQANGDIDALLKKYGQ